MFNGESVTLQEMLAAREQRVKIQEELLETSPSASLLSATMNIPGEIKNSDRLTHTFLTVIEEIEACLSENLTLMKVYQNEKTGPEYYTLVELDPQKLKARMVDIEENHPYGRLVDLDVYYWQDGKKSLSREELGYPKRSCFLCQTEAKQCGRSRAHTIAEMRTAIQKIISAGEEQFDD